MTPKSSSITDRIRKGEPVPLLVGAALSLATVGQRLGMWRRHLLPRTRVEAKVISFGNITAGGTGKTPAVIERAEQECAAGHKVAVVTRGYGSKRCEEPYFVTPGTLESDVIPFLGDEPALIARRVPEVTVIKSADRVAGARCAVEEQDCDVILLDDGFQSVMLERDEDIVLIDAVNPFGNGRLVPRGILREKLDALGRATAFILTRCDQAGDLSPTLATIEQYASGIPVRKTCHAPSDLRQVATGEQIPLDFLRDKEITAACAIGHPEAFFNTLTHLGAKMESSHAFRDHADFSLNALKDREMIVVTEKDAMRLNNPADNVYALAVELRDRA